MTDNKIAFLEICMFCGLEDFFSYIKTPPPWMNEEESEYWILGYNYAKKLCS